MSSAMLNIVWVGSFKSNLLEMEQLHAEVLLKAEDLKLGDLVSHVSASANGLTQFVIMPTASKIGWPDNKAWEDLVTFIAWKIAGSVFLIKRMYVAEI